MNAQKDYSFLAVHKTRGSKAIILFHRIVPHSTKRLYKGNRYDTLYYLVPRRPSRHNSTYTCQENISQEDRMLVLGHRSEKVNSRYTHISDLRLERVAGVVEALFDSE